MSQLERLKVANLQTYIMFLFLQAFIFADLNSSFFYLRYVAKCVYTRKNNK